MEKMREEFELWAKSEFDIDCSEMSFGVEGNDKREQYHNDEDPDGAITISAMFYAWKASRSALCVELNSVVFSRDKNGEGGLMLPERVFKAMDDAGVSYK